MNQFDLIVFDAEVRSVYHIFDCCKLVDEDEVLFILIEVNGVDVLQKSLIIDTRSSFIMNFEIQNGTQNCV